MFLSSVNPLDIAMFVGKQLLVVVAIYFVIILLLRASGYYKLKKCPQCGNKLKRSTRSSTERTINTFSFGLLPVKRYRCYSCYWEGAAFQIEGNDNYKEGTDEEKKASDSSDSQEAP